MAIPSRISRCARVVLSGTIIFSCGCTTPLPRGTVLKQTDAIRFIDRPDSRHLDPARYFGEEYAYLNARRQTPGAGNSEPPDLVGLSFSGGGIRSAAFQLGLLSGLATTPLRGRPALAQIDYISSVSGGSWANGMYWSSAAPDDAAFFGCLDHYAERGFPRGDCPAPYNHLRSTQNIAPLPLIDHG